MPFADQDKIDVFSNILNSDNFYSISRTFFAHNTCHTTKMVNMTECVVV